MRKHCGRRHVEALGRRRQTTEVKKRTNQGGNKKKNECGNIDNPCLKQRVTPV